MTNHKNIYCISKVDNFRKKFCEKFNCPDRLFSEKVFGMVVYHPLLARLVNMANQNYFHSDRTLIRNVGEVSDEIDLMRLTRNFYLNEEKNNSFLRHKHKLRVSLHRLRTLYKNVMTQG